ncbi:hypothetical protein AK812_SmicGene1311 [Symbiodinium microadriaticum]|uniref:Uncharacterized protein n=1 Tax=Symbiodinium microadriaticum TaxID=2951 RepID=A0A1Q9F4E7_SYMMI|nr:hypothetical protein AK812_SmicGene1311 [Symbiodinium microadriaticum]
MEGDASGRNVAFTLQDNVAYITGFVKMHLNSPYNNFAVMTCTGRVLCCINTWAGTFGDDFHLHVLKHLWPKGWCQTSSIVHHPVSPCLSPARGPPLGASAALRWEG